MQKYMRQLSRKNGKNVYIDVRFNKGMDRQTGAPGYLPNIWTVNTGAVYSLNRNKEETLL